MKSLHFTKGSASLRKAASGNFEEYYVEHYAPWGDDLTIIVHQDIAGAQRIYIVEAISAVTEISSSAIERYIDGPLDYSQDGLNALVSSAIGEILDNVSKYHEQLKELAT